MSTVNCELYKVTLENGTTETLCVERGVVPNTSVINDNKTRNTTNDITSKRTTFNDVILWQSLSFILLLLLVISLICCLLYIVVEKHRKKKRERADTTSTNMVSVTTDERDSVSDSLKMQDSQEQSCSSQEALPRKANNSTVTSIFTLGTTCTVIESKGAGAGGVAGGPAWKLDGGEEEPEDIEGVLEVRRGEGEGRCDPFEPDSVGTTGGLHDMLSKLGESPDPSKAGGIWF